MKKISIQNEYFLSKNFIFNKNPLVSKNEGVGRTIIRL